MTPSELVYRNLFESHPQPMWVYDTTTLKFLVVNDAACARYGYSRAEFLDMTIEDIRPAADLSALHESVANAPAGHQDSGVWRHQLKDGRLIHAEVSSHPIAFANRGARLVIAQDVTQRLEAERQAAESQELFKAVSSVATDVIWRWDIATDEVWWSEGLTSVFGHSPDVWQRNVNFWKDNIHPDDRDRVLKSTEAALSGRSRTWRDQYRFLRGDGSAAHVEESGYIIYGSTGEPVRFVGGMTDITERIEKERRLAEQAALLHLAQDAIFVLDFDNMVLFWNEGASKTYGWSHDEAIGRRLDHLIGVDAITVAQANSVLINEGSWSGRITCKARSGADLTVEARCSLLRDEAGQPKSILCINTDITQRLSVEQQLRHSQNLEALGQLTGGVAHDFNNLLTVIMGNAEVLVEETGARPELQSLADMVRVAAERGADLTRRLLAFARRQPLEPRVTQVNSLLRGMDGLLRRALSADVVVDLIEGDGIWTCLVDPSQLETAILNVCLNARDAMPEGGRLTIETANTTLDNNYAAWNAEVIPGQYVMVSISDTGHGMDKDVLERVFEPFFTTKGRSGGSGLGMSMVFGFAKQSNGHIKVYSEPGQGTSVKLYLPRCDASPNEGGREDALSTSATGGTERILVVEDDPLVRQHVSLQLQDLGYWIESVADGAEAIDALRRGGSFDLLFTDVVMPGGMSGKQLADTVHEMRPDLPVLFTSGYTENAIVHHGHLDEGVLLLNKPYSRMELASKIRSILDRRSFHRLD